MPITRLLIANRGEIALRIHRAAHEMGIETVAVHSSDDAASLHVRKTDRAVALEGTGVPAYLDIEQIVRVARAHDCDAIHPGYGFLSENAAFAQLCIFHARNQERHGIRGVCGEGVLGVRIVHFVGVAVVCVIQALSLQA